MLNHEINDHEPHNHTSSMSPCSQVKKRTKKFNCFGNSCGQEKRINFNYIIHPDQAVHPILPAHTGRSGKQKRYGCGWVHCNNILLDSAASIPLMFNMDQMLLDSATSILLMFNMDQILEQYSCNLKQKYLPIQPEVEESTKPNLTNDTKRKDAKQMRMMKWTGTKYKNKCMTK